MITLCLDPSTQAYGWGALETKNHDIRIISCGTLSQPLVKGHVFTDRNQKRVGYDLNRESEAHINCLGQLFDEYRPDLVAYERYEARVLNENVELVNLAIGVLLTLSYQNGSKSVGLRARTWKYVDPLTKLALSKIYNEARERVRTRFKQAGFKPGDPDCKRIQSYCPHAVDAVTIGSIAAGLEDGDCGMYVRSMPSVARTVADILFEDSP